MVASQDLEGDRRAGYRNSGRRIDIAEEVRYLARTPAGESVRRLHGKPRLPQGPLDVFPVPRRVRPVVLAAAGRCHRHWTRAHVGPLPELLSSCMAMRRFRCWPSAEPRQQSRPGPGAFTLRSGDCPGLSKPSPGLAGADTHEIVAASQRITVLAVLKMSDATCSWRVTCNIPAPTPPSAWIRAW